MAEKTVFKLFSSCKLTKGAARALLTDLQRNCYYTIPLGLYQILMNCQGNEIQEVIASFETQQDRETVSEYFDFLLDNELIFLCPDELKENFPDIEEVFDTPSKIANAILIFDGIDEVYLVKIFQQLFELNCQAIEITIIQELSDNDLRILIQILKKFEIEEVNLICPYDVRQNYDQLLIDCVKSLTIFNSPSEISGYENKRIYTNKDLRNPTHCGIFKEDYLIPDIVHYTESQLFNTCLNRKLSITANGDIKNCPSMLESYGNINHTTLAEAIENPAFKKYWNINKDQIEVCKDCEFRHICTDCRAYVENPSDLYSKPLKCGYDPYVCEWNEWSIHPMKQAALIHYNM